MSRIGRSCQQAHTHGSAAAGSQIHDVSVEFADEAVPGVGRKLHGAGEQPIEKFGPRPWLFRRGLPLLAWI